MELNSCSVADVGIQHVLLRSPSSTNMAAAPPRRGGTHSRRPSPPSPLFHGDR